VGDCGRGEGGKGEELGHALFGAAMRCVVTGVQRPCYALDLTLHRRIGVRRAESLRRVLRPDYSGARHLARRVETLLAIKIAII
jgi:hypothetical protein